MQRETQQISPQNHERSDVEVFWNIIKYPLEVVHVASFLILQLYIIIICFIKPYKVFGHMFSFEM